MIGNPQSRKSIIIVLALIFLLSGCNFKENFVSRNSSQEQKAYTGNISHQDMNKFLSSVKKVDGSAEAKYRLARHLQKRKRHKIALETLKEVILIDPTFVKAYNAMGFSYDYLGDFKKAIQSYKLALKINPNLDYVYNNLGFAYLLYDNYNAAIDAFQKAIALNDQNKRFHNNLGLAYAKKGQFDLAIEQFRLTGDEFSANYRLGQILYREGNYQMALEYNEKAHHAKTSAQIMSSVSSSYREKGSDAPPESKSSAVSPNSGQTSLKRDDKKIDIAQTNHSDLSKDQLAVIRRNEDLMKAAKNEKRQSNTITVEVEIEVSNGNGVNGMASRLGSYLRERGFKVTRLKNANSFNHEKTKIFYYNGHLQDVHRLLQEIPGHIDMKYIIELKQMGNRLKILIGKDMIPYDKVVSKTYFTKHPS